MKSVRWGFVVLLVLAGCKGGQAEWFDGSLKEALGAAGERDTVLAVSVTAEWCPACHELQRRFWNTRHGRKASERYVLKLVDFDVVEGQRLTSRYSIISIPTTIVLDGEGHELGRIVGFENVRTFRRALGELASRTGTNLEELEKRHAARPDDLQTALELGEAMFSAGLQKQGVKVLEQVLAKDPKNEAGAYMDATRLLGRFYIRCKQDYYYGTHYFEQAVEKFPDAEEVWEFRYWIGQAIWKSGKQDEALEYFEKLADEHSDVAEAHSIRARFLQLQCDEPDAALEAVRRAMELDPEDDWNCYVQAEILRALGREDQAMESLERAIDLAPKKRAIYLDRKEEWAGE